MLEESANVSHIPWEEEEISHISKGEKEMSSTLEEEDNLIPTIEEGEEITDIQRGGKNVTQIMKQVEFVMSSFPDGDPDEVYSMLERFSGEDAKEGLEKRGWPINQLTGDEALQTVMHDLTLRFKGDNENSDEDSEYGNSIVSEELDNNSVDGIILDDEEANIKSINDDNVDLTSILYEEIMGSKRADGVNLCRRSLNGEGADIDGESFAGEGIENEQIDDAEDEGM